MSFSKLSISLLALAGGAVAGDLPALVSKGSKLFFPNGTEFFIKGVAYQQDVGSSGTSSEATSGNGSYIDPLSIASNCERDVPLLAELGTNVIRTYAIDPTKDHSECMQLLNNAGIYVISDLSDPTDSINRNSPTWNTDLYTRYTSVIDSLANYTNVIGFFAGNEVTNQANNTDASAYVKAAVRDSKAYIKSTQSRWLGVGYAANDDVGILNQLSDYFNCGDQDDAIDFLGINDYSWCDPSSMQASGWDTVVEFYTNYSVPVFFAEYGCNTGPGGAAGRLFQETAALYSSEMTDVIIGGIVYMYMEESNDYGLVSIGSDNKATTMSDFKALSTQIASVNPTGTASASYTPTNSAAACPTIGSSWGASSALPPTPDSSLCSCMEDTLACVSASNLATSDYGAIFGYICAQDPGACVGIDGNATTGIYGAYSMCSEVQQLNYILNAYYLKQNSASSACSFNGQAQVVTPSNNASCSAALSSASSINAAAATATTPVGSGPTGTSSSSSSSKKSLAGAGASMARLFSVGDVAVGLYVTVAMLVGASMVAL